MIAKFGSLLWAAVAMYLWVIMTGRDGNLLISVVIATGLLSVTCVLLGLRPVVVASAAATTFVTTCMFTSILGGDWGSERSLPSTCIFTPYGDVHPHHWFYGWLITLANVVLVIRWYRTQGEVRERTVRLFGRQILRTAVTIVIAVLVLMPFCNGTQSLWWSMLCYATYLALLGAVCREGRTERIWFRLYLAISVSIALAIWGQGVLGIVRDFTLQEGKIPSSLIFWHPEGDPACHGH